MSERRIRTVNGTERVLDDVVVESDGAPPSLRRIHVPLEGEALRNLERREKRRAKIFAMLGGTWRSVASSNSTPI